MAIYEYECACGYLGEKIIPINKEGEPQACPLCCKPMVKRISVPQPPVMKPTGKGMALDSLNSKWGGMPNKWYKQGAQEAVMAGV